MAGSGMEPGSTTTCQRASEASASNGWIPRSDIQAKKMENSRGMVRESCLAPLRNGSAKAVPLDGHPITALRSRLRISLSPCKANAENERTSQR